MRTAHFRAGASRTDTRSVSLQKSRFFGRWRCLMRQVPQTLQPCPGASKGVSQKSLTKTLQLLEQDGLLERTIFAEVPPTVEYSLTNLRCEIFGEIYPLGTGL